MTPPLLVGPPEDLDPGIAALRERGAHQLDPARFAFIVALARRARVQSGPLRRLLDGRVAQVVAAYGAQFDAALADIDRTLAAVIAHHPPAAPELRRLRAHGDLRALRRRMAQLAATSANGPLAALVRLIDGAPGANETEEGNAMPAAASTDAAALPELRTVQRFRETWTRLRIDDQLSRSQQQVPENPGPLNSHLLVLRSLRHMQELSPAYLERFMAHVDALAWLDAAQLRKPVVAGAGAARERGKRKGRAGPA